MAHTETGNTPTPTPQDRHRDAERYPDSSLPPKKRKKTQNWKEEKPRKCSRCEIHDINEQALTLKGVISWQREQFNKSLDHTNIWTPKSEEILNQSISAVVALLAAKQNALRTTNKKNVPDQSSPENVLTALDKFCVSVRNFFVVPCNIFKLTQLLCAIGYPYCNWEISRCGRDRMLITFATAYMKNLVANYVGIKPEGKAVPFEFKKNLNTSCLEVFDSAVLQIQTVNQKKVPMRHIPNGIPDCVYKGVFCRKYDGRYLLFASRLFDKSTGKVWHLFPASCAQQGTVDCQQWIVDSKTGKKLSNLCIDPTNRKTLEDSIQLVANKSV